MHILSAPHVSVLARWRSLLYICSGAYVRCLGYAAWLPDCCACGYTVSQQNAEEVAMQQAEADARQAKAAQDQAAFDAEQEAFRRSQSTDGGAAGAGADGAAP